MEFRCRSLSDTLSLAVRAGFSAGVTRVSDVTAFGVPGIPVFQATRPNSRSLTVSQGKGLTPTAAIIGALLESVELWSAENIGRPGAERPLNELPERDAGVWHGMRDGNLINLDPAMSRGWLPGTELTSGKPCAMPWDLLSLDFTEGNVEYVANSNGLACGNTRTEALVSGIGELLEHHFVQSFQQASPKGRRSVQLSLASINDVMLARLLKLVARAGFEVRAWSLATGFTVPAFEVTLFEAGGNLDDITPVSGNGCHPDARVAFLRALLEAVQARATLVAGARDDLLPEDYGSRAERNTGILLNTLAFDDGPLDWQSVPTSACGGSAECLDVLLGQVGDITSLPVVAYDHPQPCAGLHIAHVLAPGLMDDDRGPRIARQSGPETSRQSQSARASAPQASRKILFAGPSIAGLHIPPGIEVRPPAKCGDLADLLAAPPTAVGLIDGYFKLAPTVWHKEIIGLLAIGVRVLGAASLGALRAAELEHFGMNGVGAIFEAYRTGAIVRDDAVMLVHAPPELNYSPLTVPLVDAEHTLLSLDLPPAVLRTMQRIVRTTPYETRDWTSCLLQYRTRAGEDFPRSLSELESAPSLKTLDAAILVKALMEPAAPPVRNVTMPPLTLHFRAMLAKSAPAFAASLT